MKEELRRKLQEAAIEFHQNGTFYVEYILSSLLWEKVITANEFQEILSEGTETAQIFLLLVRILPCKNNQAFEIFRTILDRYEIPSVVLHVPMCLNDPKDNATKVQETRKKNKMLLISIMDSQTNPMKTRC